MIRKLLITLVATCAVVTVSAQGLSKDDLVVTFAPSVSRSPPGGVWAMISRHIAPTLTTPQPNTNRNCSGVYAWLCAFNDSANATVPHRTSNEDWVFLGRDAPRYIIGADVDGDGRDELVANYDSKSRFGTFIIHDVASGKPRWEQVLKRRVNVLPADIDGNGRADLIFLADNIARLRVRMDNGQMATIKGGMTTMLGSGDIDGNGQEDLVGAFANRDGLFLRLNNQRWQRIAPKRPRALWLADTDGDGLPNILAFPGAEDGIQERDTNGQWKTYLKGLAATSVQFGNLDGNGRADVVAYIDGRKGAYVRLDDGQWVKLRNGLTNVMALGDIDGNGQDDIIFSSLNSRSVGATSTWAWMNNSVWAEVASAVALGILEGTPIPCLGGSVSIQSIFSACGFVPSPGFTTATYTFADLDGSQKLR